jgi:hypothetical protein
MIIEEMKRKERERVGVEERLRAREIQARALLEENEQLKEELIGYRMGLRSTTKPPEESMLE